ncbi:PREDICTED: coiled-coil domain-containing protein 17-like [Nanorana parkeri]|uniref:coiled-coil domain-containing protein 17-like n=1 Tax=Nanorana parkeri TaxID=125878 RepID=UPI0008547886|nr:PREDICTED: coiled-coil domain-containing protein 17-like [Nanorana parkeri]
MTDILRCPSCSMTFKSSLLLEKHREKFCIGSDTGKVRETRTPQDMLDRLKKSKRSNDEHTKETSNYKMTLTDHRFLDSSEKTDFEKINRNTRLDPAPDSETHLRYLADAHSKQINEILSQNKLLEKQRDDIVQRLNEITAESRNTGYLEKMIRHLNAQEQKNEQLLSTMKQQIDLLQVGAMKRGILSRHSGSPGSRKAEKGLPSFHQPFVPFYGGGTLSSEISALRMNYLQNGGNDQIILAHLQDLLTEAQLIEQKEKNARTIRKKTKNEHGGMKWHLNEKLITLEIENQQLEDELFRFQLQRPKNNRIPKTTNRDFEKGLQFPRFMKEPPYQNIKTLNAELEVLKQELEVQKLKRRLKTSVTHLAKPRMEKVIPVELNKPDSPNLGKQYLNFNHGLEPAPYDPIAGFVVFYDFLLGLDPSYRVCRMAVSLCSGGQEMGNPSVLPPIYCEAAFSKFHDNKRQNIAILATKQAVPRVRPSPSISLIIELQASGGYDPYGQEVSRLIPRGWVKVDTFDYQNRVISGQWKVPIRILPVKPSLTTGALNGVPQLENAELYFRLVNARDADIQSTYPIHINNSVCYKYPSLTVAYFHPEEVVLPSPYYSPSHFFPNMHPIYGDNVDSPPSRDRIMTH